MHHPESGKIAVLGAERSIEDVHLLNQLGRQALQLSQVALAVPLCSLILLDAVDQDFEPSADASMIQVKTVAADLERFAAPFMLSGIDAGIESMKELVVPAEQSALIDPLVAPVDARVQRRSFDDQPVVNRGNNEVHFDP